MAVNDGFKFTKVMSAVFSSVAANTLWTVWMWCSQLPPIWLRAGMFMFKVTQSQPFLSNSSLIWPLFSSVIDSFRSLLAPTKLLPWSLLIWRTGPLWLMNLLSVLMRDAVSSKLAFSSCTVLVTIQVNNTPYHFTSLLPSLIVHGPK